MAVDWLKLKTEYITTDTSYRKLSAKYGVTAQAIYNKGKAEEWVKQREQYLDKAFVKSMAKEESKAVDRYTRLTSVADKLLSKIEIAVDALDEEAALKLLSSTTLRSLSGALKDIKEIQSLKGDRDLKEQDARIRKLEREAEGETEDGEIKIVFSSDMERWSE